MAYLEIAFLTGDVERHELSKQQPVSIGSHKSNDICIDEDDVEMMHCRIAWKKDGFEAVAAGVNGLDVNGSLVQRAILSPDDVLRFGSVDVTFRSADGDSGGEASDVTLKPLTDEVPAAARPVVAPPPADDSSSSSKRGEGSRQRREPPPPDETVAGDDEDVVDLFDDDEWDEASGLEALAAESRVETPRRRSLPGREGRTEDAQEPEEEKVETAPTGPEPEKPKSSLNERLRTSVRAQQHRPGEEDVLRSPLVLGLAGGAAVLVLLGVTFYFIGWRQTAQTEFDAAKALFDEGRYGDAINQFSDFIVRHPNTSLANQAQVLMDQAGIDRHIQGAAPKWPEGLEALRVFLNNHRDDEDFSILQPDVEKRAGDISLGAATSAGKVFDNTLLDVSDEAETILRNLTRENPPDQLLRQIDDAQRASAAAILKHETVDEALARLDQQLKDKDPMGAIVTWRDLQVRYRELAGSQDIKKKLEQILDTERDLVTVEEVDRPAVTEEPANEGGPTVSLIFRARSRTDQVSVGQAVPALAQDCCYGVDTVTGENVWRRVIGLDTPFFPLTEPTLPSVVVFDTNHDELLRLNLSTGALVWRQPLEERAAGHPLLFEGQIYLPTEAGSLYKIDLESGAVSTRLRFSQPITGPVTTDDDDHIVVVGDREVAYTLTRRPLTCVAVSYLGHKPASVKAPLLTMGPYVLMCENVEENSSKLRLFDTGDPEKIEQLDTADVPGQVLDAPVIRGKALFVPSTRERVSTFTVSDDPGEDPLVAGPAYQATGPKRSPVFLYAGPDDQLWMASSALRKLQLTTDALEADQNEVSLGLASQPLQHTGHILFNARRLPFTDAVTLTHTDRDSMESEWRVVLGARLIACSPYENDGTIVCATAAGNLFRLSEDEWRNSGVVDEAELLPLHPELEEPLLATALPQGQVAIAAGDPEPRLWVITRRGQIDRSYILDAPLQLPPALFGDRLLLAIPGKIQIARGSGQLPVQDFSLASDEARSSVWRQVLVADESNLAAVTDDGQLIHIRYQTNPRPHLGEVSRVRLPAAVDFRGDLADGLLVIADSGNTIHVYDASNLDPKGELHLPGAVSNDVWLAGGRVYVETNGQALHCLDAGGDLSKVWANPAPLNGGLAGPPLLQDSRLVIVERNGRVLSVDAETGAVDGTFSTGSPATGGAMSIQGELLVPLLDGSLMHVDDAVTE